jgi:iron complex outermembrane receptor protein
MRLLVIASSAAMLGPIAISSVHAADAGTLDEVVVTARLREERIRDVPFAITSFDSRALEARRIDDTHSLFRQAPGLSLTSFDDGRFAYFQLRGIGPLSQAISPDDGSVVTYVDGVPQPVYASEFAYLDLERIEVLRGPQGTLFGRNSQGGALNMTTRQPGERFEASTRIEAGEDQYGLARLSASGPLVTERVAAGVSAHFSTFDGFIHNSAPRGGELGDRESTAIRGTLRWTPSGEGGPRFTLTANGDRQRSNPFYYVLLGQPQRQVQLDPENRVMRESWGTSLKSEVTLGGVDFTAITAFNGFDNTQFTDDTDGLIYGPLNGVPASQFLAALDFSDWREHERRFYQEFRLSNRAGEAAQWTAGLVYFRSDFDVELDNRSTFSPFLNGDRDATQKIDSYAAYAELTATIMPRWQATLGMRYSEDRKSLHARYDGVGFPGTVTGFAERSDADFDLITGRAALAWQATDDVNAYATVGRGAKSGGFPRFTLSAALGAPSRSYAESTSWTYEAGVKARLLDGRGHVDVATFYNDVVDEQLFVLDFVSFQFLPVNLDTRSFGVEVQGDVALGGGWRVDAGVAWTDGEIREASAASGAVPGNAIPNVARFGSTFTLSFEGEQVALGRLSAAPLLTLTHQYVGERAADVTNSFDLQSYHNVDLRLGASFKATQLYLFARNLFESDQYINGVQYGPGIAAASMGRDRIAGTGLTVTF